MTALAELRNERGDPFPMPENYDAEREWRACVLAWLRDESAIILSNDRRIGPYSRGRL